MRLLHRLHELCNGCAHGFGVAVAAQVLGADDAEDGAEHVLFVTGGLITLMIDGQGYELDAGGYAYIPPGTAWSLREAVFLAERKLGPVVSWSAKAAFWGSTPRPPTPLRWSRSRWCASTWPR